jgi:aldehyde:ferredoxin oxidoreductase
LSSTGSSKFYGYKGKILRLDLTNKKAVKTEPSPELVRNFISARGFGAKILWDEMKPGTDPLSPESKVVISWSPLTGTTAQSFHRVFVVFKSPLTGGYFRSVGGGFFAAEMKFAGYDGIIIEGRAEKPTYVWIHDDEVEFRDATHVWGMTIDGTTEFLRDETDKEARLLGIGPAGERLVRFACLVTDDYRTPGRGGGGAVWGAKNLKAIIVKASSREVELFNPDEFDKLVEEQTNVYMKSPLFESFNKFGTGGVTYNFYTLGHNPTYNFKQIELENIEAFKTEVQEKYIVKHTGCYGCKISCGKKWKLTKGPYAGYVWDFPEYETQWSFGSTCGVTNLEAILVANNICDRYGVDTISAGAAIAFAMELYEKGIITEKETDGLKLRWGDGDVVIELVRKIALREGIGNILAEGTKRAAEIIGRGAEKYAMHAKALELPAYDPRAAKAHGLSYATSNIGGSHMIGWNHYEILGVPKKVDPFTTEGKGELAKRVQDFIAGYESAGFCAFGGLVTVGYYNDEDKMFELISGLLYAATGIEEFKNPKYLWLVGERIYNLERAFNAREGFTRKDDWVPERIQKVPVPRPPAKGQIFELDKLLDDYYKARGWDIKTGIPTRRKLEEIGLKQVADELEKLGKLPS